MGSDMNNIPVLASILTKLPRWYFDGKRNRLACKLARNMAQQYYRIANLINRTFLFGGAEHAVFWRRFGSQSEIRVEVSMWRHRNQSYSVTMWLQKKDGGLVSVLCPTFDWP